MIFFLYYYNHKFILWFTKTETPCQFTPKCDNFFFSHQLTVSYRYAFDFCSGEGGGTGVYATLPLKLEKKSKTKSNAS